MSRSDFIDLVHPSTLHNRLKLYDRQKPPTDQPENDAADPTRAVPQGFLDAMTVREEVFVKDQHVPLENELDEDDERSYHWVAYASLGGGVSAPTNGSNGVDRRGSTSTRIPIGTIRLVPPPHAPHPEGTTEPGASGASEAAEHHDKQEPYIKLGRLAVIKEFRKAGISRLLVETALAYARDHPHELTPVRDPAQLEQSRHHGLATASQEWSGLVLVHAQAFEGVQKVWRRHGFELDESMGHWDEEGIDHVAMWRRLEVSEAGRRKSRVLIGGSIS